MKSFLLEHWFLSYDFSRVPAADRNPASAREKVSDTVRRAANG
jgi:hypothetical protein